MTDVVTVALITAVPATFAAVVGWRNSRKLDVVHELTNSNLSAVKEALAKALNRIDGLEALVLRVTGREAPKAPST